MGSISASVLLVIMRDEAFGKLSKYISNNP